MDSSIKFNVSANTAQFDSAMMRVGSVAQTTGDRVRTAFSGLGSLLAGGAIVGGLTNILNKMDDISDRAKRFGVSAEDIQKVGNAAEIVGTQFETVARAMDRTGVSAGKAAREGGTMAKAFARANLDPVAFAAASLQERIEMIAKAQQATNGDATKMAELFEVIGVRAAGINFVELAKEMGNVNAASAEVVESLAEANDLLTKMQQNATIFGANLLKALVIDPAQRVGSLLGGQGFKTQQEVEEKFERKRAADNLKDRGELLVDETGKPFEDAPLAANTKRNRENREKAKENARRIDAEVARVRNAKKAAESASRKIPTEEDLGNPTQVVRKPVEIDSGRVAKEPQRHYRGSLEHFNFENMTPHQKRYMDALASGQTGSQADEYAGSPDDRRFKGAYEKMYRQAAIPEEERRQSESQRSPMKSKVEDQDKATETTLQKVATLLQELNGKLPQAALAE